MRRKIQNYFMNIFDIDYQDTRTGIFSNECRAPISGFLTLFCLPAAITVVILFFVGLCNAAVMVLGFHLPFSKSPDLAERYWEMFTDPNIAGKGGLVVVLMISLTLIFLFIILFALCGPYVPKAHRVIIPLEFAYFTYYGWAHPGKVNSLAVAAYFKFGGFASVFPGIAVLVICVAITVLFLSSTYMGQTEGEVIHSVIKHFKEPVSDAQRQSWYNNHRR